MKEKIYFETIKCENDEVFNLEYHQRRISKTIGLNLDLQEYIYAPNDKLYRCKLIYDETGVLDVQFFPYTKRDIKSFKLIFDDEIEYEKKYLNRENIDKLFDKREDCDEIIIIKNGVVTDTSIANIAIFYENKWLISKNSLLEGTTKARLVEEKFLQQKDISVQMLQGSTKIALLNAMIGFDEIEDYSFKV